MKIRRKKEKKEFTPISEFKIDFSFRREVLFNMQEPLWEPQKNYLVNTTKRVAA
jgi:hypothetical protein